MSAPNGRSRVLIVEDEADIAGLMKHALERTGDLDVEIVGTGAAALKAVMEDPPALILLDLNLPFKRLVRPRDGRSKGCRGVRGNRRLFQR